MYNVTIDRNAMRQEVLGPLFQRHIVSLAGKVDARWLESCQEVARDADSFKRYRLEASTGLFSFTCRASDSPEVVASFLERLALFIEMINLHATSASAAPGATPAAHGLDSFEV